MKRCLKHLTENISQTQKPSIKPTIIKMEAPTLESGKGDSDMGREL